MNDSPAAISVARLLKVLLPILAIALAVRYTLPSYEKAAQERLESDMFQRLTGKGFEGGAAGEAAGAQVEFVDADADLVCDSPADDKCVTPEKLVFSYVSGPEEVDETTTWADLVAALGKATGLAAEYRHYSSVGEQLAAMVAGELHVVGLNTGAIPKAVQTAGFQPICTLGKRDGSFGYTMKLITPVGGARDPAQLAGKRIAFTTPDSNSGFKAAMDHLLTEHNLKPERNYQWGWTYSHESSIRAIVAAEYDAAPVASDILDRMIADGEVTAAQFAVLYESERFPPAAIGAAHNLAPKLREQIRETLVGFAWEGTSVGDKYLPSGAEAFAPVNFKDDWANIRRVDQAVESARKAK